MRCPTCFALLNAGETICEDCGTELSLSPDAGDPAWLDEVTSDKPEENPRVDPRAECDECGERVIPDDNRRCPVCGGRFERSAAELSFDERLQHALAESMGGEVPPEDEPLSEEEPAFAVPLLAPAWVEGAVLEVLGGRQVQYEGKMVEVIPLDVDELWLGRADAQANWFPEIDVSHLRSEDPHISRKHLRLFRQGAGFVVEDFADNDATAVRDPQRMVNASTAALEPGDSIYVSDSLELRYLVPVREAESKD